MKKIQRGCPPYEGNEPYLYFCFAEKDRDAVFPLLEHLYLRGVRIWYNVEKTDNIRKLNRQLERIHLCEMKFSIHEYLIDKAIRANVARKSRSIQGNNKMQGVCFCDDDHNLWSGPEST